MIRVVLYYFLLVILTWFYAGFITGVEFHRASLKVAPGSSISVNWFNIFYQGLAWPAYWGSHIGQAWCTRSKRGY